MFDDVKNMLMDEYARCLVDVEIAENQFNYCEPEFIECAIHKYNGALARRKAIFEKAKKINFA